MIVRFFYMLLLLTPILCSRDIARVVHRSQTLQGLETQVYELEEAGFDCKTLAMWGFNVVAGALAIAATTATSGAAVILAAPIFAICQPVFEAISTYLCSLRGAGYFAERAVSACFQGFLIQSEDKCRDPISRVEHTGVDLCTPIVRNVCIDQLIAKNQVTPSVLEKLQHLKDKSVSRPTGKTMRKLDAELRSNYRQTTDENSVMISAVRTLRTSLASEIAEVKRKSEADVLALQDGLDDVKSKNTALKSAEAALTLKLQDAEASTAQLRLGMVDLSQQMNKVIGVIDQLTDQVRAISTQTNELSSKVDNTRFTDKVLDAILDKLARVDATRIEILEKTKTELGSGRMTIREL